jgi:threonine synthase
VWASAFGKKVAFKLEYLNPTSSFKDRGVSVTLSFLLARGVTEVMDDSSGNAGASLAAYAASAGVKARIFVPAYASGPKREQIKAYGAEVIPVPGPRWKANEAVRHAAELGAIYASHASLPQGFPGYATIAFELVDQLGRAPGTIILPTGQGNLLLAMGRAFRSLHQSGLIENLPRLIGVQALACAPLYVAFTQGMDALGNFREGDTLAEGVRSKNPHRVEALLKTVSDSGGCFLAVNEDAILPGQRDLAKLGLYVEPTSAIVWNALKQIIDGLLDPVVIILTGSGLKSYKKMG